MGKSKTPGVFMYTTFKGYKFCGVICSLVVLYICSLIVSYYTGERETERRDFIWTIDWWISTDRWRKPSGILTISFFRRYSSSVKLFKILGILFPDFKVNTRSCFFLLKSHSKPHLGFAIKTSRFTFQIFFFFAENLKFLSDVKFLWYNNEVNIVQTVETFETFWSFHDWKWWQFTSFMIAGCRYSEWHHQQLQK